MWPRYYHHILVAEKLRRIKGCYNNAINVRISLDGYGSKIRNASRCRPTVSNETILATKQDFFFTKVSSVQSITDILLLGFWLTLLPWLFILSYTIIYFFINNFFSNIPICFFGWQIGHPYLMYIGKWGNGRGHWKCVQVCTWGERLKNRS